VADQRTTITELVTGLGTLGFGSVEEALAARPAEMVSLSPEDWVLLDELYRGGAFRQEFLGAWQNGVAFLAADEGLRGRRPLTIEWRGGQKQPGDEAVPADLRIDHVFLVSCKYLSNIVTNTSPKAVFDRLLAGGHGLGGRSGDWFAEIAPDAYEALYDATIDHLTANHDTSSPATRDAGQVVGHDHDPSSATSRDASLTANHDPSSATSRDASQVAGHDAGQVVGHNAGVATSHATDFRRASALAGPTGAVGKLPASVFALSQGDRASLRTLLGRGRWPATLRPAATEFSVAVADASAARWERALAAPDTDLERVLWRLLRIGSAPYFVLGASTVGSLRLRIGTAWDWRQHFRIDDFAVTSTVREQPVVQWAVTVTNRRSLQTTTVDGHVEIRWSHGKFGQRPEAKVYLDTPHHRIPGYWPLT
jgi:hypothetical protein